MCRAIEVADKFGTASMINVPYEMWAGNVARGVTFENVNESEYFQIRT